MAAIQPSPGPAYTTAPRTTAPCTTGLRTTALCLAGLFLALTAVSLTTVEHIKYLVLADRSAATPARLLGALHVPDFFLFAVAAACGPPGRPCRSRWPRPRCCCGSPMRCWRRA